MYHQGEHTTMGITTTIIVIWLGSNVAFCLAAMRWTTVRRRERERRARASATADQRARASRVRAAGPHTGTAADVRNAAVLGRPFPLDDLERDWRWADERRRRAYDRELRATVARLLGEPDTQMSAIVARFIEQYRVPRWSGLR